LDVNYLFKVQHKVYCLSNDLYELQTSREIKKSLLGLQDENFIQHNLLREVKTQSHVTTMILICMTINLKHYHLY
jgi:hypothetical protein